MIRSSRWNSRVFAACFFVSKGCKGLKEHTYQRYQQIPWTNPGTCRWLQVEVVQEQLGLCHLPLLATSLDGASTMKLVAQQQAADVDSCKRDVNSVELNTFFYGMQQVWLVLLLNANSHVFFLGFRGQDYNPFSIHMRLFFIGTSAVHRIPKCYCVIVYFKYYPKTHDTHRYSWIFIDTQDTFHQGCFSTLSISLQHQFVGICWSPDGLESTLCGETTSWIQFEVCDHVPSRTGRMQMGGGTGKSAGIFWMSTNQTLLKRS